MIDGWRELAFRWRSAQRWSMPAWKRLAARGAVWDALSPAARARLAALEARFDLGSWSTLCSLQDWRESLYVLDVLSSLAPTDLPTGRCLDVGSKNGGYLPGLAAAVPRGWDAVELDAHRRYAWGATRRAYGEAMAARLPGCRFVAGDVRSLDGPWSLVTWFLPFLSEAPLAAWGLPRSQLAPEALLRHVTQRIVSGGTLLVVNQGAAEAEMQQRVFARLSLRAEPLGPIVSPLAFFRRERFAHRWRKP